MLLIVVFSPIIGKFNFIKLNKLERPSTCLFKPLNASVDLIWKPDWFLYEGSTGI